jgi:hypothetical protein
MESASPSGSRGHPHSRRYCRSAAINRKPSTLFSKLDWFLMLMKQLCFALGTPIPIFLELRMSDAAISGPQTIDIRLVRTLITRSVTGGVRRADVARAQVWEAPGSSPHNIKLWGELTVGRRLTPTFDFSRCSIRVRFHSFFCLSR